MSGARVRAQTVLAVMWTGIVLVGGAVVFVVGIRSSRIDVATAEFITIAVCTSLYAILGVLIAGALAERPDADELPALAVKGREAPVPAYRFPKRVA